MPTDPDLVHGTMTLQGSGQVRWHIYSSDLAALQPYLADGSLASSSMDLTLAGTSVFDLLIEGLAPSEHMRTSIVSAQVYAAGDLSAARFNDWGYVTVFAVDLQAQNLPEENTLAPHEEYPGAFIGLNPDYDPELTSMPLVNGVPADGDLVPLSLAFTTAGLDGWLQPEASAGLRLWRPVGNQLEVVPPSGPGSEWWWATLNDPAPQLWVEGIAVSSTLADQHVKVRFHKEPVGGADVGSEDVVKFTVFSTQVLDAQTLQPLDELPMSHPTPVFSNVTIQLQNVRMSPADPQRIIGDLVVAGELDDAAMDLIPGEDGIIDHVKLAINGGALLSIPTEVGKLEGGGPLLKPYDFSADFSTTLTDIELDPGWTLVHLWATNAYGFSGFVERAVEVLVEPPPDQTYEYEVRVTDDPYVFSDPTITVEFRSRPAGGTWSNWRVLERQDFDTFSNADATWGAIIDFVLHQPMDGSGTDPSIWSTIEDPSTENVGQVVELTHDRVEDLGGGLDANVWKGQWTREAHDLPDYTDFDISVGPGSPLSRSEGGEFHPVFLSMHGPAGLVELIDVISVAQSAFVPILESGKALFGSAETGAPLPLIATAVWDRLQEIYDDPLPFLGDVMDANLGFAHGVWNTVPDTLSALWDGVKLVGRLVRDYNNIAVIYRIATEGHILTVDDTRSIETGAEVLMKVAPVVLKVKQDGDAFVVAALLRDVPAMAALGQEYLVALEFAAEMLDSIAQDFEDLTPYEQGKVMGRIYGEVLLTVGEFFATAGVGLLVKSATMASVASKLKQVTYLQRFAGKFDELIALYNKIDNWTDGLDGLTDGRAIAERISAIILHNKRPGEGHWKAFERFLEGTNDPKRKALVDSHLAFATNRVMRESYKEAGDILRAIPADASPQQRAAMINDALSKVPSHRRIEEVMMSRRSNSFLESHHTATKEWARELGIPAAEFDNMPALVLDRAWHRQFNISGLERDWVFHNILREEMAGVNGTPGQILERLRRTYRRFEGLDPVGAPATDPDTWLVVKGWLELQGVQGP